MGRPTARRYLANARPDWIASVVVGETVNAVREVAALLAPDFKLELQHPPGLGATPGVRRVSLQQTKLGRAVMALCQYAQTGAWNSPAYDPDDDFCTDVRATLVDVHRAWEWAGSIEHSGEIHETLDAASARLALESGGDLSIVQLALLASVDETTVGKQQRAGLLPRPAIPAPDALRFLALRVVSPAVLDQLAGVRWRYECGDGRRWLRILPGTLHGAMVGEALGWTHERTTFKSPAVLVGNQRPEGSHAED